MRFSISISIGVLVLALLAVPAAATLVLRVGVDDMTDRATVIVHAEVVEVISRWTDDRSTINTYVTLEVHEVLKGTAGAKLTMTCYGGRVGKDSIRIHGMPVFEQGEDVVVFLWEAKSGDLLPLGLGQGKFKIVRDPASRELVAKNSLSGLAFVNLTAGTKKKAREPDVLPLATLTSRIRDRLATPKESEDEKTPDETSEKTPSDSGAPGAPAEPKPVDLENGKTATPGEKKETTPSEEKPKADAPAPKTPSPEETVPAAEKPAAEKPGSEEPNVEKPDAGK